MEVLRRSISGFDLGARVPGRISDNFRDGSVGGQRPRQFLWPSCNAERGVQGQRPWPPGAPPGWPPTTLSFNLGVGGRQPGGHRARKKSPGNCKSTRRALPFVVLKFPRRAMLPRQVMATSSWRLLPSTGPPPYRPENCPRFPRVLGFGVSLSILLSRGASHFPADFRILLTRFWRNVTVKIGLTLSPNPV